MSAVARAPSTSRGIGTGPGMYCDGYSFPGEGVTKGRGFRDPPPRKKRNGRGGGPGGFSGSSAVKDAAMLMDPFAKGLKSKFGKEGDER